MDGKIREWLEKNKEEAVKTLAELIRFKSPVSDPVQNPDGETYPFGQGVQDAFAYTLAKAEELGFDTCDVDHYGGHIEWKGVRHAEDIEQSDDEGSGGSPDEGAADDLAGITYPANETVGILAHLDVVPEGEGWEHGPYSGDIEDGYIWGRGTTDDKGPMVASLFAMKTLKDAGYEPAKNIKLILGLDEETNWNGMTYYFEHMPKPDFGFTPDGDFPVLNGEKGIMSFKIAAKVRRNTVKGLELRKLSGGSAVNMVPENARAVVNDPDPKVYDKIREMAEQYEMTSGHSLSIQKMGKSLAIAAKGKAAHGSTPEKGVNAISILIGFLGQLNFINEDVCNFFDFYNDAIGMVTDGSRLGCVMEDEPSGRLSMNPGILDYDGQAISVTCDIRYPVTHTSDEVYELMMPKVDEYGLGVLKCEDRAPIYFDPESSMIKTYMDCYRDVTGDTEHGPIVIGGGTYARTCDGLVAFGALFPGDPDLMHQRNEKLELARFYQMMEIYTEAIFRLTQKDFHM